MMLMIVIDDDGLMLMMVMMMMLMLMMMMMMVMMMMVKSNKPTEKHGALAFADVGTRPASAQRSGPTQLNTYIVSMHLQNPTSEQHEKVHLTRLAKRNGRAVLYLYVLVIAYQTRKTWETRLPNTMILDFFQPILVFWTFAQQIFTPVRQSEALADILVHLTKFAGRCFLLDAIGFQERGPCNLLMTQLFHTHTLDKSVILSTSTQVRLVRNMLFE